MFCLEVQAQAMRLVLGDQLELGSPRAGIVPVAGELGWGGPSQCCPSSSRPAARRQPARPIRRCAGTGSGVTVESRLDGRLPEFYRGPSNSPV